jgi:hypothetical protein
MARNVDVEWVSESVEEIQRAFDEYDRLLRELQERRAQQDSVTDARNNYRGDIAKRGIHPKALRHVRELEMEAELQPERTATYWRAFLLYLKIRRFEERLPKRLFDDHVDERERAAATA